jgi:DNA-binding response OmpR family regulator
MALRVVLVDDNAHFLRAARLFLEREGMTVVGVASTSADALRCIDELRPDVALVDIDLGDESGFDLAGQLAAAPGDQPPVILISAYPKEDLPDLLVGAASAGFLPKSRLSGKAIIEILGGDGRRG